MTDAPKKTADGTGLVNLPGLQPLGGETALGVCAGGMCAMPEASPAEAPGEAKDSTDD